MHPDKNDKHFCSTFTLITQNMRKRPRDHLENLVFSILSSQRRERYREQISPLPFTCFLSCSLLTLISHPVTHHFFQTRAGCCRVVLPPVLLLRVVSGERSTTAWRGFWRVTRRWWQAKANHAQHFPMKAWLPHRGKAAKPSEACLPVYRQENKKWFSLFLFHPAVLQLPSTEKWSCCVRVWNMFFTYTNDFLWILIVYLEFPSTYVAE